MSAEEPLGDLRLFGAYFGVVKERNDPGRLARVRVEIPGVISRSAWAWPIANGGAGTKQRGAKWVPQLGADVIVWFQQGDPDVPLYLPAHWGAPVVNGQEQTEVPGSNLDPDALLDDGSIDTELPLLTPETAPDVPVFEFRDYVLIVDERAGKGRAFLRHKKTGDTIEHDGIAFGWTIRGTTAVRIVADGIVSIEGSQIQINGRTVANSPNPI